MTSRVIQLLLFPLLLSLTSHLYGQEGPPSEDPDASPTSGLRIVNLLAFRGEAQLLLDGRVAVRNIVTGDILSDLGCSTGTHQLQIKPLSGGKPIVTQNFVLPAQANVTLVLTGGPTGLPSDYSVPSPPLVIALTPPKAKPDAAPAAKSDSDKPPSCQLLILNADSRGPLRVSAKAGDRAEKFDLDPGRTQTLDPWPISALDLSAALATPSAGIEASAELNLFTPEKPVAYYCILYAPTPTSAPRAYYLAASGGHDLGRPREDTR